MGHDWEEPRINLPFQGTIGGKLHPIKGYDKQTLGEKREMKTQEYRLTLTYTCGFNSHRLGHPKTLKKEFKVLETAVILDICQKQMQILSGDRAQERLDGGSGGGEVMKGQAKEGGFLHIQIVQMQ